jgi:hypothetical protein
MMQPRSVEQWKEILSSLPAPGSPELAMADRVLGDLVGYRHHSSQRNRDAAELANAMLAYFQMLKEAGF